MNTIDKKIIEQDHKREKYFHDLIIKNDHYFTHANQNIHQDLKTIRAEIIAQFSNREVLFLTQSETRYLSSWLNILRDDFGCIDFKPRNSNRIINYNPLEMNDKSLKDNIIKYTKSKLYINNLTNIL